MNITIESTNGQLTCYRMRDGALTQLITMSQPATQFCALGESVFVLDAAGEVRRMPIDAPGAPQPTAFRNIRQLSSNQYHLLLLTEDGHLLLSDELCTVSNEVRFEPPVREINLGRDGTVWIAGGEAVLGGFQVFWSQDFGQFASIPWPASAVHVFGDDGGIVWTINSRKEIWKLHRLGEGNMPGCRREASCRNCMVRSYPNAQQVARVEDRLWLLQNDNTVRVYPLTEPTEPVLQIPDVARFCIN